MKKYRGWIILLMSFLICAAGIWAAFKVTEKVTAEYPSMGDTVSYPVNQVDGFELTISQPSFSMFRGYTVDWKVTMNSQDVYYFILDGEAPNTFKYLERKVDGQWHRLGYTQDNFPFTTGEDALGGGEGERLEGSIVQKYDYYGTRLEAGTYRVVLEMQSKDGMPYYLAQEFEI